LRAAKTIFVSHTHGFDDQVQSVFCVLDDHPTGGFTDLAGKANAVNRLGSRHDNGVRVSLPGAGPATGTGAATGAGRCLDLRVMTDCL